MRYFEIKELIEDRDINKILLDINVFIGQEEVLKYKSVSKTLSEKELFKEVKSTNTIEGVFVDDALNVFKQKDDIFERNEKEWIGVKIAFEFIKKNFDSFDLSLENLKKLHLILLNGSNNVIAGKFKQEEVFISQYDERGRFIKAVSTSLPENVEDDLNKAIKTYLNNIETHSQYKVVATILFIGEFLSIHPFNDGNGRMSRLMMIWLLKRLNISLPTYISLTKYIEETKGEYYDVLDQTSEGLSNGLFFKEYIKPFVTYYLRIITSAYKELGKELSTVSKEEMMLNVISGYEREFSRQDILNEMPNVDPTYVSKILDKQTKQGKLIKTGQLKGTKYKKA